MKELTGREWLSGKWEERNREKVEEEGRNEREMQ